jgi:hypothetical protein
MVNPSLAQAAVGVVEPQRSGMASGINSTFRQVGIATGIAGLGAVFQELLTKKIPGIPGEALASGNPSVAPGISRHAFLTAYTDALSTLFVIAAVIALVSAVLSFALTRQSDFVVQGAEAAPAAG